jgi:hypothetical protein
MERQADYEGADYEGAVKFAFQRLTGASESRGFREDQLKLLQKFCRGDV